jgi:hypothetical protein
LRVVGGRIGAEVTDPVDFRWLLRLGDKRRNDEAGAQGAREDEA